MCLGADQPLTFSSAETLTKSNRLREGTLNKTLSLRAQNMSRDAKVKANKALPVLLLPVTRIAAEQQDMQPRDFTQKLRLSYVLQGIVAGVQERQRAARCEWRQ